MWVSLQKTACGDEVHREDAGDTVALHSAAEPKPHLGKALELPEGESPAGLRAQASGPAGASVSGF